MGNTENAVSKATASRMPAYLRYLKGEAGKGVEYVSSAAVAKALGVSAVGVRKDLALVASRPGKPRFGFEVRRLIEDIEKFLGYHRWTNAEIFGIPSMDERRDRRCRRSWACDPCLRRV